MATPGYSGTPLIRKLGILPGMQLMLLNAPPDYFKLLEKDISAQLIKPRQLPGFIHLFAKNSHAFEKGMQQVLPVCKKNTSIIVWVSWYKKSSGIVTDLGEDKIRDFALRNGLVDVKVCAVSEEWSGLKLVVPLSQR